MLLKQNWKLKSMLNLYSLNFEFTQNRVCNEIVSVLKKERSVFKFVLSVNKRQIV